MDLLLWLIITALIGLGLLQSGQFPPFAFTWNTLLTYAGILLVARLLQGIFSIPPKFWNESKRLKGKYEGDLVEADLAIFPFPHFSPKNIWRIIGVGIRVENHNSVDLKNVSVELDSLTWQTERGEILIQVDEAKRVFLRWNTPNQSKTIIGKGKALIDIAEIQNDKIRFILPDYNESRTEQVSAPMGYEERAEYHVALWIKGKIGGRPIHAQKFEFSVLFVRVMSKWVSDENGWHEVADYRIYTSFLLIGTKRDLPERPQFPTRSHIIYAIGSVTDDQKETENDQEQATH